MEITGWGRRAIAAGLAGLLCLPAAQAQVRNASRHVESDRQERQAEQRHKDLQTLERLDALFDAAEFEAKLELGDGSLRGVMGYSEKHSDPLVRLLKKPSVAVADREFVFLLPMTRYVQAWYEANSRQVARKSVNNLNSGVWKYMGLARTDRNGNFAFDGLMPGRYVVFSEFPVASTYYTEVDTGERSVSYHGAFGNITGASVKPVYRKQYGTATSVLIVGQAVDVAAGRITSYKPVAE